LATSAVVVVPRRQHDYRGLPFGKSPLLSSATVARLQETAGSVQHGGTVISPKPGERHRREPDSGFGGNTDKASAENWIAIST
jgi:hypothetical protein